MNISAGQVAIEDLWPKPCWSVCLVPIEREGWWGTQEYKPSNQNLGLQGISAAFTSINVTPCAFGGPVNRCCPLLCSQQGWLGFDREADRPPGTQCAPPVLAV